MTDSPFNGARLKIERANQHITDLEAAFQSFVKDNPHPVNLEVDLNTCRQTLTLNFGKPLPWEISLILGDAIHNLRTSLDHATWELFGLDRGEQGRYTKFPAGDNRINYEALCRGMKTPRQDTKEFLVSLAAYPGGGGDGLYALNQLDNADKHTVITPTIAASRFSGIRVRTEDGRTIADLRDSTFASGGRQKMRLVNFDANARIELDADRQVTLDIRFGNVEPVKFEPVFPTLKQLRQLTEGAVGAFESFVATRV